MDSFVKDIKHEINKLQLPDSLPFDQEYIMDGDPYWAMDYIEYSKYQSICDIYAVLFLEGTFWKLLKILENNNTIVNNQDQAWGYETDSLTYKLAQAERKNIRNIFIGTGIGAVTITVVFIVLKLAL